MVPGLSNGMRSRAFFVETVRLLGNLALPAGNRGRLPILIFHSVCETPDSWERGSILKEDFDTLMEFLAESFSVLSLTEGVQRLEAGGLPARSVAITFDDGYLDNVELALPILLRYGLTATFFVATGTLDGGMMWNDQVREAIRRCPNADLDLNDLGLGVLDLACERTRIAAFQDCIAKLKYLPVDSRDELVARLVAKADVVLNERVMMNRGDIDRLSRAGMSIGAHTVSHPILACVDDRLAEEEILEGKQELTRLLGEEVTLFAYPNGVPGKDYLRQHVEMLQRLGFYAAVTTSQGAANCSSDRYQLPRFTPWDTNPIPFGMRLIMNGRKKPHTV